MIRYFALATVIVIALAVAAAAYVDRDLIRIKIASVYAPYPAKPAAPASETSRSPQPFSGDAPWALSALPECLTQVEEATGTVAYVRERIPKGAVAIESPATLRFGDCTILVRDSDADVERGADRFHIPPASRFYRSGDGIALLHTSGGKGELRVYARSAMAP